MAWGDGAFSEAWLRRPRGEERLPGRGGPGSGRSRRAVGRVIPQRVARQQSPPPFHPAWSGHITEPARGQEESGSAGKSAV